MEIVLRYQQLGPGPPGWHVDAHMVRYPCPETAENMIDIYKAARNDEDAVGGVCSVPIRN